MNLMNYHLIKILINNMILTGYGNKQMLYINCIKQY